MLFETGSPNLNVIIKVMQFASKIVLRDFGEIQQLQNSYKGVDSFVSASLEKLESTIVGDLETARPKYGYITPTKKKKGEDSSHNFLVKALSGKENFKRGVPHMAISIALQEQNKIIAGVVYNPILDVLYYAEKGQGAFLYEGRGSRRLRIKQSDELKNSHICVSSTQEKAENNLKPGHFKDLQQNILINTKSFGAPSLDMVYTADNKFDAFLGYNEGLFEMAAPMLIFKEAGGSVAGFNETGDNIKDIFYTDFLVASSERMTENLKKFLFVKE